MGSVNIFGKGGVSVYNLADSSKALITLAVANTGEANSTPVYLANAPQTGIRIKQLTDHSVNKALGGDFLLNSFGDTPVDIQLSGLNFFAMKCDLGVSQPTDDDILQFYDDNKVSANPGRRLDITINSGKSGKLFRCALIGMQAQSASDPEFVNILYTYTLSLIGAPKNA